MAGSAAPSYSGGWPQLQFVPQTEPQPFSSSIADLKRDKEISELKDLVNKLTKEVNRLESMISLMGVETNSCFGMDEGPYHDFTVLLRPDDNGTYVAYVPAIPGCHAWGQSLEEACAELVNVFEMIKEEYEEEGKPLPPDISLKAFHACQNQ